MVKIKKMKNAILLILALAFGFSFKCENTGTVSSASGKFNKEKDLLLVQFDCKTDVDDVQSAAALATLLADSGFSGIKYHAVAGTYGIQEGLYVPPNELFQLAFGDNWSDAHENAENALRKVMTKITETLLNKGDIWIADAGQSDFTARLISALKAQMPEIIISQRIHVVQHSDWNEESTSPETLK